MWHLSHNPFLPSPQFSMRETPLSQECDQGHRNSTPTAPSQGLWYLPRQGRLLAFLMPLPLFQRLNSRQVQPRGQSLLSSSQPEGWVEDKTKALPQIQQVKKLESQSPLPKLVHRVEVSRRVKRPAATAPPSTTLKKQRCHSRRSGSLSPPPAPQLWLRPGGEAFHKN